MHCKIYYPVPVNLLYRPAPSCSNLSVMTATLPERPSGKIIIDKSIFQNSIHWKSAIYTEKSTCVAERLIFILSQESLKIPFTKTTFLRAKNFTYLSKCQSDFKIIGMIINLIALFYLIQYLCNRRSHEGYLFLDIGKTNVSHLLVVVKAINPWCSKRYSPKWNTKERSFFIFK